MKSILALTLTVLCSPAFASVQGIVNSTKATVLIQGPSGDMDAPHLFEAMNVLPIDVGNAFSKRIEFKSNNGESLFDLICKVSKTVPNFGSCTLAIYRSGFATFDSVKGEVFFMVSANLAWDIVRKFRNPDSTGSVFYSSDSKLGIKVDNAGTGAQSLRIWFRK